MVVAIRAAEVLDVAEPVGVHVGVPFARSVSRPRSQGPAADALVWRLRYPMGKVKPSERGNMGTGIIVIGASFVDIKGHPHGRYIKAGRNAGKVIEVHGGVARNIAEDIANVGLHPTFLSVVDQGGTSNDILDRLERQGCDVSHVCRAEDGLGMWLAVFDHTGDLVASISRRPNLMPLADVLDEVGDEVFSEADAVAIELDLEAELLERVIALAERHDKPVFCAVSNMSIASERRDLLQKVDCLVCNEQEAEILFSEEFGHATPDELSERLFEKVRQARIDAMVVTLGARGSVYASSDGQRGVCPPQRATVVDTTGAGDSFFAGVTVGLTYGKGLAEACGIGTRLASSVIATKDNVCPRFLPAEFGITVPGA